MDHGHSLIEGQVHMLGCHGAIRLGDHQREMIRTRCGIDVYGEPALRMDGRRSARHRDAGPRLVDGPGDARLAAARLGCQLVHGIENTGFELVSLADRDAVVRRVLDELVIRQHRAGGGVLQDTAREPVRTVIAEGEVIRRGCSRSAILPLPGENLGVLGKRIAVAREDRAVRRLVGDFLQTEVLGGGAVGHDRLRPGSGDGGKHP